MSSFEDSLRYGGAQADDGDEATKKAMEREAKKAEVRKRLEEAGNKKKGKKGFLTPERKKKLRKLLMIKAAEDLKRQQLLKEQERVKILAQRTIALPDVESINDKGKLEKIYNDMFARLCQLEEEKYDINQVVTTHDATINQLNIEVNDLRGKYVKPALKKVSKYNNKFKKMAEAKQGEEKADFRSNLKVVKKENIITQIANKKKADKPDWTKKEKKEEKTKEEGQEVAKESEPVESEDPEEVEEDEEEEEEEE